jgi:hypothetical protein
MSATKREFGWTNHLLWIIWHALSIMVSRLFICPRKQSTPPISFIITDDSCNLRKDKSQESSDAHGSMHNTKIKWNGPLQFTKPQNHEHLVILGGILRASSLFFPNKDPYIERGMANPESLTPAAIPSREGFEFGDTVVSRDAVEFIPSQK